MSLVIVLILTFDFIEVQSLSIEYNYNVLSVKKKKKKTLMSIIKCIFIISKLTNNNRVFFLYLIFFT